MLLALHSRSLRSCAWSLSCCVGTVFTYQIMRVRPESAPVWLVHINAISHADGKSPTGSWILIAVAESVGQTLLLASSSLQGWRRSWRITNFIRLLPHMNVCCTRCTADCCFMLMFIQFVINPSVTESSCMRNDRKWVLTLDWERFFFLTSQLFRIHT